MLVWLWLKGVRRRVDAWRLHRLLRRHGVEGLPRVGYTYWMNVVLSRGGGEATKPCEFFFDTPWQAKLHEQVVRDCPTWEFVTTVTVTSDKPLTVTDYAERLEWDDRYADLVQSMRKKERETAMTEMTADANRLKKENDDWQSMLDEARRNYKAKHQ
ncbi:MAG: hypothetical protein K6E73_10795 [Bacteroidales bacterium]|nr:hypothetical protein [Bacteroidales bacterium]